MTRAAIKHAEDSLRSAMLERDVETLERLLDDEVLFVSGSGGVLTKHDDLANYRSGRQVITGHKPRELQIALFGEEIAIATVIVELEGSFDDRRFSGTYRYIRTWRRNRDGAWCVIAAAGVAVPDA